jgi:hypothetical protein
MTVNPDAGRSAPIHFATKACMHSASTSIKLMCKTSRFGARSVRPPHRGWWNLIVAGHTGHLVETATGSRLSLARLRISSQETPRSSANSGPLCLRKRGRRRRPCVVCWRAERPRRVRVVLGRHSGTQNRRRHQPPQSSLDRSDSDDRPRCWDTPLQNRWCKCILVVDQAPVPYRGISNLRWLWWRDRVNNLPDADNASHPAIVVDDG